MKSNTASPRFQTGERDVYGTNDSRLDSQEVEALHRLKEYLKHKNPTQEYDSGLLLRYCYLGQFRTNDSVEKFKYYEEWWNMASIPKEKERMILQSGVVYCYGKDEMYSPNIYFNPSKANVNKYSIQDYMVSLRTLLTPIEENMLVSGKLEKWNVIVDLREFQEKNMKKHYPVIVNNLLKVCNAYPYRTKHLFVIYPELSMSRNLLMKVGINGSANSMAHEIIEQLNLEQIHSKIYDLRDLDKFIPEDERERKYGGKLENLLEFWPISSTNRLMEINSRFIDGSEDSVEYNSIINDKNASFFAEKEEKTPLCNFRQSCSIQ